MNDRALRKTVCSLGSIGNGYPREDGFDIVVASEVMAIFCLANNIKDLDDNDAKTLYENLIELIELDWSNRSMQDNYRVYICEVERVLGSRGLL